MSVQRVSVICANPNAVQCHKQGLSVITAGGTSLDNRQNFQRNNSPTDISDRANEYKRNTSDEMKSFAKKHCFGLQRVQIAKVVVKKEPPNQINSFKPGVPSVPKHQILFNDINPKTLNQLFKRNCNNNRETDKNEIDTRRRKLKSKFISVNAKQP